MSHKTNCRPKKNRGAQTSVSEGEERVFKLEKERVFQKKQEGGHVH